jgi:hypothetical protein
VFEVEVKKDQIKLKIFFQLQFMKETVKLKQSFLMMIDRIIIDLPAYRMSNSNVFTI